MASIGFKTKEMERQEKLPVVAGCHAGARNDGLNADQLADAVLRARIKRRMALIVEQYIVNKYTSGADLVRELDRLRDMYYNCAFEPDCDSEFNF